MMRSFLKRKFQRRHMMVLNQRMVMLKITMRPGKDKMKVLLFSLNLRSKDKCVAEGTLVSKDKTYVLGDQYVAVSVSAVSRLGDMTLVRPYDKFQTVRDDIGHVLALPLSHVKKPIPATPTQLQNKPPNTDTSLTISSKYISSHTTLKVYVQIFLCYLSFSG